MSNYVYYQFIKTELANILPLYLLLSDSTNTYGIYTMMSVIINTMNKIALSNGAYIQEELEIQ